MAKPYRTIEELNKQKAKLEKQGVDVTGKRSKSQPTNGSAWQANHSTSK